MEASSCVDAVVITAAIVASALIYIWVIKQIGSENVVKWRVVFARRKTRELYTIEFYSVHYPIVTNYLFYPIKPYLFERLKNAEELGDDISKLIWGFAEV